MCACVCVCACRSCDREGRKNKGGGEKDREVKNSCVDKVVYTYVCMQVSMYQPQARFFPQNMMFRNGSICAMKSVPGRAKQNNGLSFLSRNGDIIMKTMKTVSFRITD